MNLELWLLTGKIYIFLVNKVLIDWELMQNKLLDDEKNGIY